MLLPFGFTESYYLFTTLVQRWAKLSGYAVITEIEKNNPYLDGAPVWHFPDGELDVVFDSRNSNKMAAVYIVHTSAGALE